MARFLPLPEYTEIPTDLLADIHFGFERLGEAKTLSQQADAYVSLANDMHQLVTWHPRYDIETGTIEGGEE